ncbi:MAG: helix-turn-helix domain-containing protein [Gaiellales bacterium]
MFEIGNSLLEARSRQELDLNQLETDTRIRAKYLRALEEEQFDALPGDAYARGFLRIYAGHLGLDPQVYVDEYNTRFAGGGDPAPQRPRRRRGPRRIRLESHALVIALVGIVVLTGLVIAAWQVGDVTGRSGAQPTPAAAPAPAPSEPEPPGAAAPDAAGPPAGLDESPTQGGPTAGAKLVIVAVDGRSGVVVREPNRRGEIVFGGMLDEGERREFHGMRFHVVADRPEGLAVEVNDEAVSPLPPAPAAFVVTEAGVEEVRAG